MTICVALLIVSGGLVVYSYLLYPLLLWVGTHFLARRAQPYGPQELPRISIVVAAHNEERTIEGKILNTEVLQYPREKLELLVGSDGSVDATDDICRSYPWVKLARIEPRAGKANVLNNLIPRAQGEIIVLSDANTIIEPQAIMALVAHFADPEVGGVCGHLILKSTGERLENSERTYWSYESGIKELESRCHSTIAANGGIYAIRKSLFKAIPTDTIIDDFLISLDVLAQGKRLLFERDAVAYEEVSKSFHDEFWRKVRIGAGNLQVLWRKRTFFFHVPLFVGFAYLSHKVIRWVIPLLLIVIWVCALLLLDRPIFGVFFGLYNLSLLVALAGVVGVSKNRVVLMLAYGYLINLALLIGYARFLLRTQRVTWRRAER